MRRGSGGEGEERDGKEATKGGTREGAGGARQRRWDDGRKRTGQWTGGEIGREQTEDKKKEIEREGDRRSTEWAAGEWAYLLSCSAESVAKGSIASIYQY